MTRNTKRPFITKAIVAVMLVGTLAAGATAANAQQRIVGHQRPGYGYGEAYHGRYNTGNPDRNYLGPNVLHGGGPY
jgi:hypothetical protein